MNLKIGSLFDGSGGFPLSASMCGIDPTWASEVEPFPIAVTRSRFPNMKHLGSVTDVKGDEVEPVDVITFGSPCQDLSVAGKRAGLKHTENGDEETTRSGLFMEAIRIIKEMRKATNGVYPRFAVWENVPGAFSSNKGEDFRIVLEEFIKVVEPTAVMPEIPARGWPYADYYRGEGWSLGYRTFDAQFWGVPQRRRRIYLVADFRGQRAGEVLFEREGLRGYFTQSREKREEVARYAENGSGAADCTGERVTAFSFDSLASNSMKSANPNSGCRQTEISKCIDTTNPDPSKNQGGVAVVEAVPYTLKIRSGCDVDAAGKAAGKGALIQENMSATLAVSQDQYLFQPIAVATQQGGAEVTTNGVCPTVTAAAGMSGNNQPWVAYPTEPVTLEPGIAAREGGHIYEGVSGTLRANMGDNQMAVAYSVENHPADSRVNIDDSGKVQTLTSRMGTGGGNVPMVMEQYLFENHSQDTRYKGPLDVSPIISATFGMGGNNQPFVVEQHPFCKGARPRSADDATVWKDAKVANTLNTFDLGETRANELVVEPYVSRASGGKVTGCLMASGYDKLGAQEMFSGDYTVVEKHPVCCIEGNGSRPSHMGDGYNESDTMYTLNTIERHAVAYAMQGFGDYKDCGVASGLKARDYKDATDLVCVADHVTPKIDEDGVAFTLNARDYKDPQAVAYEKPIALDRAFYNQGANAQYEPQFYEDGTVPTLVAKGPGAVAVRYIVRRLTPTECARLQGFPDKWAHPDQKTALTDDEYRFWMDVRNTHAEINGKTVKEYTREQMLTWYNKLHTDSAEYKLWGNGIALPCALYVMEGISDVLKGGDLDV